MVNFSLKSRRRNKGFTFLFAVIILILLLIVVIDFSCSLLLNQYLDKAKVELKDNIGIDLSYSYVFFDIFSGVLAKDLSVGIDGKKIFDARGLRLRLDILNMILKRKLSCRKIFVNDLHIYKVDSLDKDILSAILSSVRESEDVIRSTMIFADNLNFMDLVTFDIDGYAVLAKNEAFLSRGKVKIKDAAFFKDKKVVSLVSQLEKNLNYVFEATYLDDDFIINKLELTGYGATTLLVSGKINEFTSVVNLELEGDVKNLLLDDVRLLNNEYISTKGFADITFLINGPAEDPLIKTKIKFNDCHFNILDAIYVRKINSTLDWDGKDLSLELSGLIEDSPLDLVLDVENRNTPQINLKLLIKELDIFSSVAVNYQGYYLNRILGGDVESIFDTQDQEMKKTTKCIFKNMYFNFQDLNFRSSTLDMIFQEEISGNADVSSKEMLLRRLNGNLKVENNNLEVNNFHTELYRGTLSGSAAFGFEKNEFIYDSKIYLQNLEIDNFVKDFLSLDYQLTGTLSGAIALNNERKQSILGDIQIVDGRIEDNSVMVSIADFFGLPSLETINFNKLRINFQKVWDKYKSGIDLFSDDIQMHLDNQSLVGGPMDSYLAVRLTTSLMDESPRFKKLFKYLRYEEPTVFFPFKLWGYVGKPRIEWLQNEFKEKLADFLPEGHKKILQDELNKVAVELVK